MTTHEESDMKTQCEHDECNTPMRITEDGQVEYLRHKVAQGDLPDTANLTLDVIALRGQVHAVRALHRRVVVSEDWGTEVECGHCCTINGDAASWPCATVRALEAKA